MITCTECLNYTARVVGYDAIREYRQFLCDQCGHLFWVSSMELVKEAARGNYAHFENIPVPFVRFDIPWG